MAGGVINTALSVIFVGPGLTLNGSTLSATPGTSVKATTRQGASYPVTSDNYEVTYTGGAGNTVTLPDATANGGVEFLIKNAGTGSLTLDATALGGLWTVSLVSTMTLLVGESVHVISDGTNWQVAAMASGIIIP